MRPENTWKAELKNHSRLILKPWPSYTVMFWNGGRGSEGDKVIYVTNCSPHTLKDIICTPIRTYQPTSPSSRVTLGYKAKAEVVPTNQHLILGRQQRLVARA